MFISENFHFLVVKFSVYLNGLVFVMLWCLGLDVDLIVPVPEISYLFGSFYLFVLRFYGPVNPMGLCRAQSVYLITRLMGRLSSLSG